MTTTATTPAATGGLRLLPLRDDAWRVIDDRGQPRGHLDVRCRPEGTRYRARRYRARSRAFVVVGEFWSADEALAALRG